MRFDHNDTELAAGFTAVRQYDPQTYDRMQATRWHVSNNPFDLAFDFALGIMSSIHNMLAEGITLPGPATEDGEALTWVNIELIRDVARDSQVTPAAFMAEILVHEFRHVHTTGHNEQEAFTAGSEFAKKIPGHDGAELLKDSERSAAFERANPVTYNPGAYGMAG